jgi:3-hydroxyacyl-[acyl-carrier-protein] dehydratase
VARPPLELDVPRILRILPNRPPLLMIDRVVEVMPRQRARGLKAVSANEALLLGHFPGAPTLGPTMVLEALFQLVALFVYTSDPFDVSQRMVSFVGVDDAKFKRAVVPGDLLELEVSLARRRSNIWKCDGVATVGQGVAADASILAAVVDRDAG